MSAGSVVSGIDAVLQPGAQILGTVTEEGTGRLLSGVEVCLWRPGSSVPPEYTERCARTDSSGNYAIRSLPANTYAVVFSQDPDPYGEENFVEQWWQGAPSAAEATPLTIAPPQTITGIDAQLVDRSVDELEPPLQPAGQVPLLLSPLMPKAPPRKCKKGFHRKLVKGKRRCVRKKSRHQRRRHSR